MERTRQADLADAIVAAPAGTALLAVLEHAVVGGRPWPDLAQRVDPGRVERAVDLVAGMDQPLFLECLLDAADLVGPWMPHAMTNAATAYTDALARSPIASAVADRFSNVLDAPLSPDAQQWWSDDETVGGREFFRNFGVVYGGGAFTFGGLWTVTDPPDSIHAQLIGGWDFTGQPMRWRMPVLCHPRIHEIHRPDDWVQLVNRFPAPSDRRHGGWELPGHNQTPAGLAPLLAVAGQHAASDRVRYVAPDWEAVANHYDGVHLSWAGFLTAEGYVTELNDGGVAMLRYWGSERTLWLRDVFGEPEPLPHPPIHEARTDHDAGRSAAAAGTRALDRAMGR